MNYKQNMLHFNNYSWTITQNFNLYVLKKKGLKIFGFKCEISNPLSLPNRLLPYSIYLQPNFLVLYLHLEM